MKKLLKKNVIVSFAVFLAAVSIGGAAFGWFLFAESQSDQNMASKGYTIEETGFHEGYAALSLDDDSFDLFDSKKDYGYVDVNGSFVIEPKLYAAKEVRGGYAIAAASDEAFGILKFD